MLSKLIFFLFLVTTKYAFAYEINIKGTLKVGREVIDAVEHNLHGIESGRRQLNSEDNSPFAAVKRADICKDLDICKGKLGTSIQTYAANLGKTVQRVLTQNLELNFVFLVNVEVTTFDEFFRNCLKKISKLLQDSNKHLDNITNYVMWSKIIKSMSGIVYVAATKYTKKNGRPVDDTQDALKVLLLHELTKQELEMQENICTFNKICRKNYPCTRNLNKILKSLIAAKENQVREFIREFSKSFQRSALHWKLGQKIREKFGFVLDDMGDSEEPPEKLFHALQPIQIILENRLIDSKSNHTRRNSDDLKVILVNGIMSDMDHVFYKVSNIFSSFMRAFNLWLQKGVPFSNDITEVMKIIGKKLMKKSNLLKTKLYDEVETFLKLAMYKGTYDSGVIE